MTGKVKLDSYTDAGILVSIDLVNELVVGEAEERGSQEAVGTLKRILAVDDDGLVRRSLEILFRGPVMIQRSRAEARRRSGSLPSAILIF